MHENLSWQERNKLYKQNMGFDWYDVKVNHIECIGEYWQAGIGTGSVQDQEICFIYCGSLNRNETFYSIAQISPENYQEIKSVYQEYISIKKNSNSKEVPQDIMTLLYQKYVKNSSSMIMEGWELI